MPTPQTTQARHKQQDWKLAALRAKVERYTEARRIAEEYLEALQASPDWAELCERHGLSLDSDLGDWSC